jgi:prophage regulatory protein
MTRKPAATTLVRMPQVIGLTGLSRSTILRRVRAGTFPAPAQLGRRTVAWSTAEVQQWIAQQLAARRPSTHVKG